MNRAEFALMLFMRGMAAAAMLAIGAVIMPHSWMSAIHAALGLGSLPKIPIIEYLTRSLSALYAFHGVLMWVLAGDLRRYRPLAFLSSAALALLGVTNLLIDLYAHLPWHWTAVEGPFTIVVGVVMLALCRHIPQTPRGASC